MLKILNLTNLSNYNNYGQRLQTYALQKYIKDKFDVIMQTIDTRGFFSTFGNSHCFDQFNAKYIQFLKVDKFLDDKIFNADAILVGGDQNFNCLHPYYTCQHYDTKMKLMSYSSSATSFLDDAKTADQNLMSQLSKFKMLSFREKSSYDGMKNAIKTRLTYNIDPVFLLSVDEWLSIARKPSFIKENEAFDFSYFVKNEKNAIKANDGIREFIYYGNNNNADNVPPDEFLWLVSHCRKLKTTSFHGVAFGVIFQKPMQICDNKAADSRIKNLISLLGLECKNGCISDFKNAAQKIIDERKRSYEWLKECLMVKDFKYAGYAKDQNIRNKASSGGVIPLLAKSIIEDDGIVYGAAYADDFKSVKTICIDNMDDYFKKIVKSKYSECYMPDLNEVKQKLESQQKVLFIGCPCQVKKLKEFLGKDYVNLIAIDLLCNGYSRNEFLRRFVEEQEKKENSKITSLDMRLNHSVYLYIKFANGKEKILNDVVTKIFVCNKTNYIEECKTCNMHTSGNSHADLTIGDFWGFNSYRNICDENFNPKNGSNVIYVNTERGLHYFNCIKNQLEWRYLR